MRLLVSRTVAMMNLSPESAEAMPTEGPKEGPTEVPEKTPQMLLRFDRIERWLHWANAILFGVLLVTAAMLYQPFLATVIGRRGLVRDVHVISGLLLPVPIVLALAGPWNQNLRRDLRRLNRWIADDFRWARSLGFNRQVRLGKFNAGQKFNTAFTAGSIVVMLGTGVIMRWFDPFSLQTRRGATFVHDWLSLAILIVIVVHIQKALSDSQALRSMFRGTISSRWAEKHAPRWYEEELVGGDGLEDVETSGTPGGP